MAALKICMISSEAGPFARTGGLGDVLAALPSALGRLGHEVRVFVPLYRSIDRGRFQIGADGHAVTVPMAGRDMTGGLHRSSFGRNGVTYYFVENASLFDRQDFYRDPDTGKDFIDNDIRFAFFARSVLEFLRHLNWHPDVINVHDWQAALAPAYLRTVYADHAFFQDIRTVLTIHNLGYQGMFEASRYHHLGLPDRLMTGYSGALEFYERVNFLKGGISLADKVTTVSERYAHEIQTTEEFGFGLQGVLADRSKDLCGILNGVDYGLWSPSKDKLIPGRYTTANLSGKRTCRVELLNRAGLPYRDKVPVVGMITRLTDQKGVDLVSECADELFSRDLQMIVLGVGDEAYHHRLQELQVKYPDKLRVYLEFNDILAHWIQAGSDIFLMPSRYEPCGLNQMYALKYGTVPVVRAVGGLADTVEDYQAETGAGTGFVFEEYTSQAMLAAVDRAVELYKRRQRWVKLMKAGMTRDFSWDRSAEKYAELFSSLA